MPVRRAQFGGNSTLYRTEAIGLAVRKPDTARLAASHARVESAVLAITRYGNTPVRERRSGG